MATSSDIDSLSPEMAEDMRAAQNLLGGMREDMPAGLDALRKQIDADLAEEENWLGKLRARPTGQRIAMVVGLTAALMGLTVVATPRPELADYPGLRMAAVLVSLGLVTAMAIWRLLRPVHLPRPSTAATRALLVAGLLAPTIAALWPMHSHVGHPPGEGLMFALSCGRCLAFGSIMGAPFLALAMMLRRAKVDGAAVVALAGVAAGLAGNLTLQLHCPITDPVHLVVAHAGLAVILAVVALKWE